MTDETDKVDEDAPEERAEGPLGGERLAEARREKQISVLEIAKELHVEESKIRALENNDFDALGAPVFAKGHLKKYSQLVGVNHDDVLADYYQLTRSQEMPPVIVKRKQPGGELKPGPWVAGAAVLLLLALAYWLLVERPVGTPSAPAVTAPAVSQTAAPAMSEPEQPESAEEAAEEGTVVEEPGGEQAPADEVPAQLPAAESDQAVSTPPAATQPATTSTMLPAAGDGDVRMSVTFIGDCWTEITDASGRRLFFQLGRSGRTVNVSGPGPLSVLFGDAANVEVRVNGEDFIIPAANRRGRTARLTISGT